MEAVGREANIENLNVKAANIKTQKIHQLLLMIIFKHLIKIFMRLEM